MTSVVTPSENSITAGQIGKVCDLLTPALRKSGLQNEPTQQVIEHQGDALVADMVAVVRKRVEAISNLIVRHAIGNRNHTPEEALKATGRRQYVTDSVVKTMPRGATAEADVYFFKPDKSAYDKDGLINDDNLAKEYELRGLKPADPYLLAAVNEADPAFADDHPNGTHWKDKDGKWCYAAFYRWYDDERRVLVDRYDDVWGDYWWFAGVRK
mgnify:CR=1 FL=1